MMNGFDMTKFDMTNFDARAVNKQVIAMVDYWTETYMDNMQKAVTAAANQFKTVAEKQVEFTDTILKTAKKTAK